MPRSFELDNLRNVSLLSKRERGVNVRKEKIDLPITGLLSGNEMMETFIQRSSFSFSIEYWDLGAL